MTGDLLNKTQVAELIGYHPEHVARIAREGRFPMPLRLGPSKRHQVRWFRSEVEQWISDRAQEREKLPSA